MATALQAVSVVRCFAGVQQQQQQVATFQGLKAMPALRTRGEVSLRSTAVSRRALRILCAADIKTLEVVAEVIADQLAVPKDTVLPESKFTELGADSLDTVEIMMALEEKFDIQFEEENAEKIETVQNAADLIQDVMISKKA